MTEADVVAIATGVLVVVFYMTGLVVYTFRST